VSDDDEKTKLLIARGEIEQVLKRHDICGHVALFGRGRMELMLSLDASWSRLSFFELDGRQGIRLRSMIADYGGDVATKQRDLADSVGMCSNIGFALGSGAMAFLDAAKTLDEAVGAEHSDIRFEPKQ
jgi:hypothetical protein